MSLPAPFIRRPVGTSLVMAAIFLACLLRFRPIMMTTPAALLTGLPPMLDRGAASEFRNPVGVAMVGGLLLSQALTLYTTPVVYLYLDALQRWLAPGRRARVPALAQRMGAAGAGEASGPTVGMVWPRER
jgi:hypothetical protein